MSKLREQIYTYKKQCEVWMVNLGVENIVGYEQKGTRPFYIISSDEYNKNSKTPIGFFMSTSKKKETNNFTYKIKNIEGHVNITQIRTISEDRFIEYMGISTKKDFDNIMELFRVEIL